MEEEVFPHTLNPMMSLNLTVTGQVGPSGLGKTILSPIARRTSSRRKGEFLKLMSVKLINNMMKVQCFHVLNNINHF